MHHVDGVTLDEKVCVADWTIEEEDLCCVVRAYRRVALRKIKFLQTQTWL
jgi:hypothetical protein